jgi:aryl-alcohol dehydrogenase-like predicted oxidoreductase
VEHRPFGTTGLLVPAIGVGCSRLGGAFSDVSSAAQIRLLRAAIDEGVDLFDTSDYYSQGRSEVIVGRAVKGRRDAVIIATKGGFVVAGGSRLLSRVKPLVRPVVHALGVKRRPSGGGAGGPLPQDFSAGHLRGAVDASLRRLATDHIDIYQLHSPPRSVVEGGEFVDVLDQLKAEGKILHYGIAVEHPDDAIGFEHHDGIESLQLPFSAIQQRARGAVLPAAASRGIGVIARSCFAAGLLVGSLPEAELRERTPDCDSILAFRAVAARLGRPPKELAVQLNLGVGEIATTLLGMSRPEHLTEGLRLASAPRLTHHELEELRDPGSSAT